MTQIFDALVIPPEALDKGGVEVLRAAIVDGDLHVTLRRAFEDPVTWGVLLADVARHVARIYATEDTKKEAAALAEITAGFTAEMNSPTDTGSTSAVN
jgi:hypothetical protein